MNQTVRALATLILTALVGAIFLGGCQPKVQVEAPKEPITINLGERLR
jgi:hypothetical protein